MPLLILVADDDLGIRLSVSDYLEMSGYLVVDAKDGLEALSLLERYSPHLLITDINMPRLDGYELVKQVRQRPTFRLLPVIFLTERASTEERIKGYQLGCDLYLPKPFEMQELSAMIRNLLERSQVIQSDWRFSREETPKGSIDASHQGEEDREVNSAHHLALNFTSREQQVLDLLATGLSNADIGHHIHLSARTVEKYVSSLLRKTETSNRAELVRFALQHHLVN